MSAQSDRRQEIERLRRVKAKYGAMLMAKAHVTGVGIGIRHCAGRETGELALVVMVSRKVAPAELAADDLIPVTLDGLPVDVQATGSFRAL